MTLTAVTFVDGPLRGRDLQLDSGAIGAGHNHATPASTERNAVIHHYRIARAQDTGGALHFVGYLDEAKRVENFNEVLTERWRFQSGLDPANLPRQA